MIYGSVCSGIEAATVAWHPLGWTPKFFSEIEPFPKRVLAHHYPGVPDLGDFTKIGEEHGPVDLIVGGTPCQSFSVAGLRAGLDDPRGNLMLEFGSLARRLRARWLVWENVPGVLSSNGGRDFGSFLGMLGELGYGFAYRVLDAQFWGLAQRRKRCIVVGHARGFWQRAAAVLFEPESLRGDPPPSREAGQAVAGTIGSLAAGGFRTTDLDGQGAFIPTIAPTMRAGGNSTGGDRPPGTDVDTADSLIAFDPLQITSKTHRNPCHQANTSPTLHARGSHAIATSVAVRRLTPREVERLMGFPDDYTAIPGAKDGPRYRALGNSMAVPVMRWIGSRIQMVEDACRSGSGGERAA